MKKKKVSLSWSGGKDSAMALYTILKKEKFEVVSLHTSFDAASKRVGLHGVPEILIEKQAAAIGLPLEKIYLPNNANGGYEKVMKAFCQRQKQSGVEAIIFGDIFLEDLKAYRERQLKTVGIEAIFPLWGSSTLELVNEFISLGFETLICCLNTQAIPKDYLGKTLDKGLVGKIAQNADPCGENGEFHTFVYKGPIFQTPVHYRIGSPILKSYPFKKEQNGKIVNERVDILFQELLAAEN